MQIDRRKFLTLLLSTGLGKSLMACTATSAVIPPTDPGQTGTPKGKANSNSAPTVWPVETESLAGPASEVGPVDECVRWDPSNECVAWHYNPAEECVDWTPSGECVGWAIDDYYPVDECVNWSPSGECIGWESDSSFPVDECVRWSPSGECIGWGRS